MFAFLVGLAAVCAVNVWVSRSMHDRHPRGFTNAPVGS